MLTNFAAVTVDLLNLDLNQYQLHAIDNVLKQSISDIWGPLDTAESQCTVKYDKVWYLLLLVI